ncbi:hypothetical protein HNR19_000561 [Nocardioides thalensis]|uniref:Uncharacterized protein n=1 Tax=Nocardioides thalensis TaxID=1914755 RepID=A0A853C0H9_9ACTN|nr:hypothetical protein [Nocardioides thalensis]NYI99862.1 hypothetical protein [Nocardioides thalensis]
MSDAGNRPDQADGVDVPPDDELAPEIRSLPDDRPDPEEYEPDDPDTEAIADGGTDMKSPDPGVSHPEADDGVEP